MVRRLCLLAIALLAALRVAQAADPQPYNLKIDSTGIAGLDAALHGSSQLESLRTGAPAGPFALVGRAQQDVERLRTALESYGYYRSTLSIKIEGRALDDPKLPEAIQDLPASRPAQVDVGITLGPLFHLRRVSIDGELDEHAKGAFALESGAPAVASDVLAARSRLLDALEEEGHAFARVDEPVAYEDATDPVLDVTFKVDAGPIANIGDISFHGLKRMNEAFVRKRLLLHTGDRYSPSSIERARTDLLSLGTFSGITVQTPTALDAQGRVPIVFEVQERLLHAVTLNAAYSSDLGGSAGATWSDRDLFGNAEQLNLSSSVINMGGSDTNGLGYDVSAQLIKPDFLTRDQSWQTTLTALKQNLDAYDQTAAMAGTSLNRKLSSVWSVSAGVSIEREHILQEAVPYDYTLFAIPLSAKYDSTDLKSPLEDALHGARVALSVAPTESLGNTHATYLISQATISTYFDFERLGWAERGRSVLALRGLAGEAHGAAWESLPPDQRFYAGGSTTVRGFRYQSLGPQFSDHNPIGGTSIVTLGAEFRQRFGMNWGGALFIDAGEVSQNSRPFEGCGSQPSGTPVDATCVFGEGYGAGVRYYTPIGPIRIDVALPVHRLLGGDSFEIYVGLGQAF